MKAVLIFSLFILLVCCSGCQVKFEDVSDHESNKDIIGIEYEIVGDVVAYGIRKHPNENPEYITLVPPPGFEGFEVAFRKKLDIGSTITITKVVRTNRWFDSKDAFIVRVDGMEMSDVLPVRLELFRGNEGEGRLQLNPAIYQKVDQKNNIQPTQARR